MSWNDLVQTQARVHSVWCRWRSDWHGPEVHRSEQDVASARASFEAQERAQGRAGAGLQAAVDEVMRFYTQQQFAVHTKICRTDQKAVSESTITDPDGGVPKNEFESERNATTEYYDGTHSTTFSPASIAELRKADINPFRLNGGTLLDPHVLCLYHLDRFYRPGDVVSRSGSILTLQKSIASGEINNTYTVNVDVATGVPTTMIITDPGGQPWGKYTVLATEVRNGITIPTQVRFDFGGNVTLYDLLEIRFDEQADIKHLDTLGRVNAPVLDYRFGPKHVKIHANGHKPWAEEAARKLPDVEPYTPRPRPFSPPYWLISVTLIVSGVLLLWLKSRKAKRARQEVSAS